jgi:hypothetical protein
MFYVLVLMMFPGSIALPRFTILQTPRTVKVLEPVPYEAVPDRFAEYHAMLVARIRISTHPKHLLQSP